MNRSLEENVISTILNSQDGVYQEGCRVARGRPGRHIILRQYSKLPKTDMPEIHTACLHKLVLRLIRDNQWNERSQIAWIENEQPSELRLMQSYRFLKELKCIMVWEKTGPSLSDLGDEVLK